MKIQKFEYLKNEKSFLDVIKNIFQKFLKGYQLVKKKIDKKWRTQALLMMLYKGGRGVKNLGKSDYVRTECSYVIRKRSSI